MNRLDLDTVDEKGSTKRARLEKVKRDTDGKIVPPELLNEVKLPPEGEDFLSMFFELYHPESSFHVVLNSYMSVWDLDLDGEDISLLQVLWRTAENHRIKTQKEKLEQSKKQSKGSGGKPARPKRTPRRR